MEQQDHIASAGEDAPGNTAPSAVTDDDSPTIEVEEIDPAELGPLAHYHHHYRALGFTNDTMVLVAPTLVVPLARPEPPKRASLARLALIACAGIALVLGSGCVAFAFT